MQNIRSIFGADLEGHQGEGSFLFGDRGLLILLIPAIRILLRSVGHAFECPVGLDGSRLYAFQEVKIHAFEIDYVELFDSGWSDGLVVGILVEFLLLGLRVRAKYLLAFDLVVRVLLEDVLVCHPHLVGQRVNHKLLKVVGNQLELLFVLVFCLLLQLLNDQLVPVLEGVFSSTVEVPGQLRPFL
jgi:hypothetical protein